MAYTNEGMVEDYLAIDIDNSLSARIALWAVAVDRYINHYTGQTFGNTDSAVRYFDGNGLEELTIDQIYSITSVEILENGSTDVEFTLAQGQGSDYMAYPYNETPKYKLILLPNGKVNRWVSGKANIKITGVWGNSTGVPEDIQLAATILLAGIIEKGLKGGSVLSESLGDYSVSFKLMDDISNVMGVKDILENYKTYRLV